jgi:shikimate kinase
MIISLCGFMGCGKSCVGKELGKKLGCGVSDLDDYIEAMEGRKISAIFKEDGEPAFRTLELKALKQIFSDREIISKEHFILSLGGGTVTVPQCAAMVHNGSRCFYLKASVDTLVYNLTVSPGDRPALANEKGSLREKVSGLLARREAAYEAAATDIIMIDGLDSGEIAEKIMGVLGLR